MAPILKSLYDFWCSRVHPVRSLFRKATAPSKRKVVVLFYRDFLGFTGGHLKVWDYFEHVRHSDHHQAQIAFSAATVWNFTNPWLPLREQSLARWDPDQADILFLAGMDWSILSEAQRLDPPKPVINLIQHVRHADPEQPLYPFLRHRAIRICVSEPVTEALKATGQVNGPLFTIANGIDLSALPDKPQPWESRCIDILIVGLKQPALATVLRERLATLKQRVKVLIDPLPRAEFLQLVANARIALLLPHATEGFYLPALEGFALETLVICPDCIGNRPFCLPEQNCLQPDYTLEGLLRAVQAALQLNPFIRKELVATARQTAQQHSLLEERRSFLAILKNIETIWGQ